MQKRLNVIAMPIALLKLEEIIIEVKKSCPEVLWDRIGIAGGAVRDVFLGLQPQDIDIVVEGSTPEEMIQLGFKPVSASFPVFICTKTGNEYALTRTETKVSKGHLGFTTNSDKVSFKLDSERRDFSINSGIYTKGMLISNLFFYEDLIHGVLRKNTNAFKEDPLRILRLFRFSARLGFIIEEETFQDVIMIRNNLLELPRERINLEITKVLGDNNPSAFFRLCKEAECLQIVLMPLFNSIGIPQGKKHHSERHVFEHNLRVLDEVAKITTSVNTRFAALFHDIGKPGAWLETGCFHDHNKPEFITPSLKVLLDLKFSKEMVKGVQHAALWHHFIHNFNQLKVGTIVDTLCSIKGPFPETMEQLQKLMDVSRGDALGRLVATCSKENIDSLSDLSPSEIEYLFENPLDSFDSRTQAQVREKDKYVFEHIKAIFTLIVLDKTEFPQELLKNRESKLKIPLAKKTTRCSKLVKFFEEFPRPK